MDIDILAILLFVLFVFNIPRFWKAKGPTIWDKAGLTQKAKYFSAAKRVDRYIERF